MPVIESEHAAYQEDWLAAQTADAIMAPAPGRGEAAEGPGRSGVVCVFPHMQVGNLVDLLAGCSFHGFPVVQESPGGPQTLVGIVLREQVYALLKNRVWETSADLLFLGRVGVAHAEATKRVAEDIHHATTAEGVLPHF